MCAALLYLICLVRTIKINECRNQNRKVDILLSASVSDIKAYNSKTT